MKYYKLSRYELGTSFCDTLIQVVVLLLRWFYSSLQQVSIFQISSNLILSYFISSYKSICDHIYG